MRRAACLAGARAPATTTSERRETACAGKQSILEPVTSCAALIRRVIAICAVLACTVAYGGADLEAVKRRGVLRCGVSEAISGLATRDRSGRWSGMEIDFCRALAAAVLADPRKVEFVPLKASARFPALQAKSIDLLMRSTTWTLAREVLLKVQFPAVFFYDGQGFLVPKAAGVQALDRLDGTTICVEKGTTHQARLPEYFQMRGWSVKPLVIDSERAAAEAFLAGRCAAYTGDASLLAGLRARSGEPEKWVLLPERISKEPLGPVVRGGDAEWATLVRWVAFVLIAAEEHGVTQANAEEKLQQMQAAGAWRIFGGKDERVGRALGVPPGWALRVVKAVGNYGEIYERHFGAASAVRIERGLNRLWTQGGLLYAPPID